MRLHLLSDLHNEFAPFEPDPKAVQACDLVVLAGDIDLGTRGISWAREVFGAKPVIYVLGNHEFFGQHWTELLDTFRAEAKRLDVQLLENDSIEVEGVQFLGCSLWTDFRFFHRRSQSGVMRACEKGMYDFKEIRASRLEALPGGSGTELPARARNSKRLTARHVLARHQSSVTWLRQHLLAANAQQRRPVVVTHHLPSSRSIEQSFAHHDLTASFASHLDDLIPSAGLWLHGHAHVSSDYVVRDGRGKLE